jgi:xylulokinase
MDVCVAAVDIGTTGSKGTIFNLKGTALGSAYREYPCTYPKPGWVEQDPDLLVKSAMEALQEAVVKSGVNSEQIKSVSVSAQRCCGIFLGDDEKLLRPMISWQDNRPSEEVAEIAEKIDSEEYYRKTGFPNSTTWLLSKMMWIRKNEPEIWKQTKRVVQMHDYFLRALGADDYIVDLNDAGFFGFFDSEKSIWDQSLLDLFNIDPSVLPVPMASGTKAGAISSDAACKCGLKEGTIIAVGAGDQCAGALGAGVVKKGTVSVSMGTAGAMGAFLDKPFRDPTGSGMVTSHSIKGNWLLEAHQAAAGGVYRWFRDEVAALEKYTSEKDGLDFFKLMDKKIADVPVGSKGLLLLPYYAGAATPRYDSSARGVLIGLTFAHDRACMARAYLEGITLDMKDILSSFTQSGVEIKDIHILGGPTKSELWNQIQADVYGLPVSTLEVEDATLLGAAILAAVGAGLFKSIEEGADQMVQLKKTYTPIVKNTAVYSELYDLFCRTYQGLKDQDVFERLSALQSTY